jgi:hypothetical protein
MIDLPPSVVEQLRLALLSDVRTIADALNRISDEIDVELAGPSPNLGPLQNRFLDLTVRIETRTRLHARLGFPGEPIATWMLTFSDSEEREIALEVLDRYRGRVFEKLISGEVEMNEKDGLLDSVRLLTDFLCVSHIDPDSAIELRRADGSGR